MISIYQQLYYRLYTWCYRYLRETDLPHFYGFGWLTVVEFLNVFTVVIIFENLIGGQIGQLIAPTRVFAVLLLAVFAFINYWIFLRGKKVRR